MDFIAQLPSSQGKTTILVVVDHLSKYAHFCAYGPNVTAPQLAEILAKEICHLWFAL